MSRTKLLGYLTLGWPPHAFGYVVVPLLVSRLRHGETHPIGVPFVVAGASLIAWAIVSHYRSSPPKLPVPGRPTYLVTSGAYSLTRNPLYLGGLTMWIGWAILFSSIAVVLAGTVLFGFLALVGIPFEERQLRRTFGDMYDAYRARVPRWIGRYRRERS